MDNNVETSNDIDLLEIARLIWSKIIWILLAAAVCGIFGLLYGAIFITPKYEASINMIVNSGNQSSGTVTSDSITSAQKLAQTYAVIIKSNKVLNTVREELSLDLSYEALSNAVSIKSVDNTPVINVTVRDGSAERATLIVSKIAEVAPPILADAVEAGSCKIVSDVYSTGKSVALSIPKSILIAALIGALLAVVAIVVRHLIDNTFKSELDIQNMIGLPVLGVLPSVESCINVTSSKRKGA